MSIVEAILNLPSPFLWRTSAEAGFTIVLSVHEGVACRFAASTWTDQLLTPIVPDLISEIGWKTVEHSARHQVVIRCTASRTIDRPATAEIDRGSGFLPLLVIASREPVS